MILQYLIQWMHGRQGSFKGDAEWLHEIMDLKRVQSLKMIEENYLCAICRAFIGDFEWSLSQSKLIEMSYAKLAWKACILPEEHSP